MNNTIATITTPAADMDSRAKILTAAADIGTANAPEKMYAVYSAAAADSARPAWARALAIMGMTAHRAPAVRVSLVKKDGILTGSKYAAAPALDALKLSAESIGKYADAITGCYIAAARYNDAFHGGDMTARAACKNTVYTELKAYWSIVAGDAIKATADDAETLRAAIDRAAVIGLTYEASHAADGTITARAITAARVSVNNSMTAFTRALEDLTARRIYGLDGVLTAAAYKAAAAAAKDARAAVMTAAAALDAAALQNDAAPEKPAPDSTTPAGERAPDSTPAPEKPARKNAKK